MDQTISMQAIRERYPGEWVLIAYTELDEEMRVLQGEVIAHSSDRDEIYRQLFTVKGRQAAIEYTGEVPEDLAVVL